MENDTELLLKHIDKLRKEAVTQHPTSELKKYWAYYSGKARKGTSDYMSNKYNIIKGIVDTKCTLVLDNDIVSTVMPRLKTFVDENSLSLQNDIADILKDINSYVLDDNNFEKIKSQVVLNKLIYGSGFTETIWSQDEDNKLGDIKINFLNPLDCFPDMAAKTIEDCNFFFIRETYSPITLKKKYPEYAKKMQSTMDKNQSGKDNNQPTGVFTTQNDGLTSQAYSYGGESSISPEKQKNITVWKCYLKDDSTFVAKESEQGADPKEAELKFKYPNGRLIIYVDGANDYVLEDKPIDYPFGFPIDTFSSSTVNIFGDSQVKYLVDIQDRINRAWERVQYLVSSYVSFIAVNSSITVDPDDIINQAIFIADNISDTGIQSFTNNTLSELNEMIAYIDKLKETAYEISRVNPTMISGERPEGVNSGEQIVRLNESPMLAIKEEQRHFKYFVCEQGKKNIVLIQLFYNTPRMIRLTNSKQVASIPAKIDTQNPEMQGLQQEPIQILEQKQSQEKGTYYEAIRQIQGDLSIGEYDMQIIAGTEMPRSRSEKAQLTMQLAQAGYLGSNQTDIAETVLTAVDYPQRHQVIDKLREQEAEMSKNPPVEPPTDKITVNFKDLDSLAQAEWYQSHGFPQAAEKLMNIQNIETLKNTKDLLI